MVRHTFGLKQLQADAVVAGDRAFAQLIEGRSNRWLLLTLAATLTITVAVTSIVGLGSVAQIFDYIGLDMAGRDVQVDPRHWLAVSETLSQSARTATRVTSLSATPVSLKEQIMIPFEYLYGGVPGETRFRENDIKTRTRVFYQLNGTNNGLANLVQGGTAAISAVTVKVQQYYDDDTTMKPPLFRPWWKPLTLAVPVANAEAFVDLDLKDLCRGITILQNTNKGMVSDIINKVALRGARQNIIGAGQLVTYDEFARGMEFRTGGNVYASPLGGIVHVNLQESGRLTHCLNPNQDSNLRLYFDVQPSSVAGMTFSEVRILLHLLERNAVLRSDNQYVTAPNEDPRLAHLVAA